MTYFYDFMGWCIGLLHSAYSGNLWCKISTKYILLIIIFWTEMIVLLCMIYEWSIYYIILYYSVMGNHKGS